MTTWTDDRVESLKALWADGYSATQIAAEFGDVSRNSVLSKIHRVGAAVRSKGYRHGDAPPKTKRKLPAPTVAVKLRAFDATEIRDLPPPSSDDATTAFGEPVDLFGLTAVMCRWPINEGSPFMFCGAMPMPGTPYCSKHCACGFNRPGPDQRRPWHERRAA